MFQSASHISIKTVELDLPAVEPLHLSSNLIPNPSVFPTGNALGRKKSGQTPAGINTTEIKWIWSNTSDSQGIKDTDGACTKSSPGSQKESSYQSTDVGPLYDQLMRLEIDAELDLGPKGDSSHTSCVTVMLGKALCQSYSFATRVYLGCSIHPHADTLQVVIVDGCRNPVSHLAQQPHSKIGIAMEINSHFVNGKPTVLNIAQMEC